MNNLLSASGSGKNIGCTIKDVCGKEEDTSNLQDLLIFVLKGISVCGEKLQSFGVCDKETSLFVARGLFATITNGNWDNERFTGMITEALRRRDGMRAKLRKLHKEKDRERFRFAST